MFSDSRGDVAPGSVGGLVHEDTRFVSRWELRLDGRPLSLLKSGPVDYDSAAFFLTNPDTPRLRAHSVAVRRLRLVGGGALEQIAVFNTASESISCELRLLCAADFADLFEIKSGVRDRSGSTSPPSAPADALCASATRCPASSRRRPSGSSAARSSRAPRRTSSPRCGPSIEGTDAVWALELPPRCSFLTLVKVGVRVNNVDLRAVSRGFRRARSSLSRGR